MSGGHWNYIEHTIADIAKELNPEKSKSEKEFGKLLLEISKILHSAEWYYSGDYGLDTFEKDWSEFKVKWIKDDVNYTEGVKDEKN